MRCLWLLPLIAGVTAPAHAQQMVSVAGSVFVRTADDASWTAAVAGMALAAGTSISTGPQATAEIRVDASDSFVAAANSQLKLGAVENEMRQLELTGGKIVYQAADPAVDALRVNLPGVAVEPLQPGIYEVAHAPGGQSQITVQAGLARVVAPSGSELIAAGQKMLIRYTANGPEFRLVSAFSRWRRFLTFAAAAVQIAGNISAGGGGGSAAPPAKPLNFRPRGAGNSGSLTSRAQSDPPAKSGPPPSPPPSRTK